MTDVRHPVVLGPITGAKPPWGTPRDVDLKAIGYVAVEYHIEGEAVAYTHAAGTAPTPDGRWVVEEAGTAPYRTRILVIRPVAPPAFNGVVLLHWQNVSAGYELGSPSAEAFNGFAWVGVSAQEVGLYGLPAGMARGAIPRGLPLVELDPERYGSLLHPGDAGAHEIFTQAARAVGPDRRADPDPMGGLDVRAVVAVGGSQSAMRLVAYANGVHPLARAVDAFLLSVWEGRAPRLEEGPISFGGVFTTVRDDLDVPVLIVNSEFEAPNVARVRTTDTPRRRVWEVAGAPHGVASGPTRSSSNGWITNTLRITPVYEAAVRHIGRWATDGTPAPAQPRIQMEDDAGTIRRDADGNAIGGIRLPEMAAAVAEHRGMSFGTGRAPLFGASRPFAPERIRELFPTRQDFVARWHEAVDELVASGAIRPEDGPTMKARADEEAPAVW